MPNWSSSSLADPIDSAGRVFGPTEFTALWASLALGLPALMTGLRIVDPDGLGLTLSQLFLAIPLGIVIGTSVIAASAWAAAYNGVPTALLVRPALGVAGSWVVAILQITFLFGWSAVELGVAGEIAASALKIDEWIGVVLVAVLAMVFVAIGLSWFAHVWLRRFAFWMALMIVLIYLWDVFGGADLATLFEQSGNRGLWRGADLLVALAVLWFPIVGDVARFADSESVAASGAGTGFGVPVVVLVLAGGLAGLSGQAGDGSVVGIFDQLLAGASSFVLVVVLGWLVVGESDQPYVFSLSGATALSTLTARLAGRITAGIMLVGAAGLAALVPAESFIGYLDLMIALLGPIAAVFLADFFVVRRRDYLVDELYKRSGIYGGVNLYGLVAVVVGFLIFLLIDPVGPQDWVTALHDFIPGDQSLALRFGMPPAILSMTVSFLLYVGLGRWKIQEQVYVSHINF